MAVTWMEIVVADPAVGKLEQAIKRLQARKTSDQDWKKEIAHVEANGEQPRLTYCGNQTWYENYKPLVVRLIGRERKQHHSVLSSSEAYEVAYKHLYELIPACERSSCPCIKGFVIPY